MRNQKESWELASEIHFISETISMLSNVLPDDAEDCHIPMPDPGLLKDMLTGFAIHLNRVADDVDELYTSYRVATGK